MKRFAVVFSFLTISVLYGQTNFGLYTGAGYGGILVSSAGIDDFVSAYNNQRSMYILKKMESPGTFSGVSFHVGMIASNVMIEFGYFNSSALLSAEADPAKVTSGGTKRDIDVYYSGVKFSLAWIYGKELFYIGPVLEMPIVKFKGETSTIYRKKYDFDIDDYFGMSPGVMLVIGTPGKTGAFFTARATYTFGLGNPDWEPLYNETQTIGTATSTVQKGSFGGFTFSATLSASIGCL